MKKITPVFIFSLPRSGSTLLQKMLASHDQISSVSEPWILLPIASFVDVKNLDIFTNYSHLHTRLAIDQFIKNLPEKEDSLYKEMHDFIERLYSLASSPGAFFFVDKTPRYYLIIDFIAKVFPEAKFIFLFRNPLDILSSILTTWGGGKLHITHWAVDLFRGPFCLEEGYRKYKERSIVLHYHDLIQSPEISMQKLSGYLGVKFSALMISNWSNQQFAGDMGDVKIKSKSVLETKSLGQWKRILNTHIRRRFASWYINYLGNDVINIFGDDILTFRKELKELPCSWKNTVIDTADLLTAVLGRFFLIKVLKNQRRRGIWKAELLG